MIVVVVFLLLLHVSLAADARHIDQNERWKLPIPRQSSYDPLEDGSLRTGRHVTVTTYIPLLHPQR